MKKKSLGVNALLNSLQTILSLIFPLITFPYASRILSVDGMGKFNFSNSIVSYFSLIASLGISTFAIREGAKYRDDREKISKFASRVFTFNLASTLIAYIALAITLFVAPALHKYLTSILLLSISIILTTLGTDWVYTIFEEYGYLTLRNIIVKILSMILLFVFVRSSDDYLNYVGISVFASVGSNILNFIYARKLCDIKIDTHFDWKSYAVPIFTIFAVTVAIQIYVSSDVTILGFLKNDYVVGIYSTSVKIYCIIGSLLMAIQVVTIPRLAMLMGQHRMREYRRVMSQLFNTFLLILLPGMTGLFMVSPEIIYIIAGPKYIASSTSLRILVFAMLGSGTSGIFGQCALMPAKRERKNLISSATSAVLNIVLNFILIPFLSYDGAALTTVLAECTMMFMNYYYSRDITGFVFRDKTIIKNVIIDLLGCVGIILSCLVCQHLISSNVGRLISSVVLSGIIYVIIVLSLRQTTAVEMLEQIKFRIQH